MLAVSTLQKVRDLLKRGWCQKNHAIDAAGVWTPYQGDTACAWCISGAILRLRCEKGFENLWDKMYPDATVIAWNDAQGRTKGQVLRRISAMIAYVKRHTKA